MYHLHSNANPCQSYLTAIKASISLSAFQFPYIMLIDFSKHSFFLPKYNKINSQQCQSTEYTGETN